jgi:two-component system heavy metal sensor histidine kinase CusS
VVKAGSRRHPMMSIALRMTIWYALSAFALISVATGLLYWVLVTSMYQEALRDLAANLNNARLLLRPSPAGQFLQSQQKRPSWAPAHQPEIYLRVLDAEARTVTETPGMADELPPPIEAELATIGEPDGQRREVVSRSGKPFLTLIVRVTGESASDLPQFMQVAMDREHQDYLLARYRERFVACAWRVSGPLFSDRLSHRPQRDASDRKHRPTAAPGRR